LPMQVMRSGIIPSVSHDGCVWPSVIDARAKRPYGSRPQNRKL